MQLFLSEMTSFHVRGISEYANYLRKCEYDDTLHWHPCDVDEHDPDDVSCVA